MKPMLAHSFNSQLKSLDLECENWTLFQICSCGMMVDAMYIREMVFYDQRLKKRIGWVDLG